MPECAIKGETCGFKCTGWDGSELWKKWEEDAKKIPCETCRDHAVPNMSGFHDHHNAGLSKPIHDLQNYERFVHEINCVYNHCKKDGRC